MMIVRISFLYMVRKSRMVEGSALYVGMGVSCPSDTPLSPQI